MGCSDGGKRGEIGGAGIGGWSEGARCVCSWLLLVLAAAFVGWQLAHGSVGHATSGGDPYSVPLVVDTNPDPNIVETTLTAQTATVDIGDGVMAHAETFNGAIPGPDVQAEGRRHRDRPLSEQPECRVPGIHWHGIELSNGMDGTPFTQNPVPPGGSFLYKFTVTRPGIFWYHPHHDPTGDTNTNQVFSGLYGEIIVRRPERGPAPGSGDAAAGRSDEADRAERHDRLQGAGVE